MVVWIFLGMVMGGGAFADGTARSSTPGVVQSNAPYAYNHGICDKDNHATTPRERAACDKLRKSIIATSQADAFRTASEISTAFGLYFVTDQKPNDDRIQAIVRKCLRGEDCSSKEDRQDLLDALTKVAAARGLRSSILINNRNAEDLKTMTPSGLSQTSEGRSSQPNFKLLGSANNDAVTAKGAWSRLRPASADGFGEVRRVGEPTPTFKLDADTLHILIEKHNELGKVFESQYSEFVHQSYNAALQSMRSEVAYVESEKENPSDPNSVDLARVSNQSNTRNPASANRHSYAYNATAQQRNTTYADKVDEMVREIIQEPDGLRFEQQHLNRAAAQEANRQIEQNTGSDANKVVRVSLRQSHFDAFITSFLGPGN